MKSTPARRWPFEEPRRLVQGELGEVERDGPGAVDGEPGADPVLDPLTLLLSEAASERIDPKVEGLLALRAHPLLHDAIAAYFEHEMDVGRTAQALCLHPNTLRYRLGHLEELLGLSLKQPAAVTALYVALVAGERPGD